MPGTTDQPVVARGNIADSRSQKARESDWRAASGLESFTGLLSIVATYPKSGVAHNQSVVFDDAARGGVLLRERAGRNFVLVSEELYVRQARAATETIALLPMLDSPPERIPELPGYAWTANLAVVDRASFQHDSLLALRRALEEGDWHGFDRNRDKWRDTARVMDDSDLRDRLLEVWDEDDEVEIRRP